MKRRVHSPARRFVRIRRVSAAEFARGIRLLELAWTSRIVRARWRTA
jgi:hypothetical protein